MERLAELLEKFTSIAETVNIDTNRPGSGTTKSC
jgi:hypothetical protein